MLKSPTVVGRLLEEISWEGNARTYHEGGRGRENVLTAEVCQALDFLPRKAFFGAVLSSAVGAAETVKRLAGEVESATFSVLPGDLHLSKRRGAELWLQPDAVIESPSVYCLLEAKRIRPSAFQPEQLTREFLAAVQHAQTKRALLLLLLPAPPPVLVTRHGRLDLSEAIGRWLESVSARCECQLPSPDDLRSRVDDVVAYTTWPQIRATLLLAKNSFSSVDDSLNGSVMRLANAALTAIAWHGTSQGQPETA